MFVCITSDLFIHINQILFTDSQPPSKDLICRNILIKLANLHSLFIRSVITVGEDVC